MPDRNKPQIIEAVLITENLGMASFRTGVRFGVALGEARTPDEAIENIARV